MKTFLILLLFAFLVPKSGTSQINLKLKSDTLAVKNDSLLNKFSNRLNFKNPFRNDQYQFVLPDSMQFPLNQNLAVLPNQKSFVYADKKSRMPILKPHNHWNMPVMKPDSNIHFHMQIKKIE